MYFLIIKIHHFLVMPLYSLLDFPPLIPPHLFPPLTLANHHHPLNQHLSHPAIHFYHPLNHPHNFLLNPPLPHPLTLTLHLTCPYP